MLPQKLIVGSGILASALATPALARADGSLAAPEAAVLSRSTGEGFLYPRRVAVDGQGNVVLTGFFHGTVDLGAGALQSGPGYDILVVKWDPAGHPLWSRRFGGSDSAFARGLATDAQGNVLIAGYFRGELEIGAERIQSDRSSTGQYTGNAAPFVAKVDADGHPLWSRKFGGSLAGRSAAAVVTDPIGNVLVAGQYYEDISLGESRLEGSGQDTVFLAKLDAAGAPLWLRRIGEPENRVHRDARDVAVDAEGNAFVTGPMSGGASSFTPSVSVFVAKVDHDGQPVWDQRFGTGPELKFGNAVVPDGEGGVFVAGDFAGDLGLGLRASAGEQALFLARLDARGATCWARSYAGTNSLHLAGLAVDGAGNLLATGHFDARLDLGSGPLQSAGARDGYVAAWSPDGAPLWSLRLGDARSQYVAGIAADHAGHGWVVGWDEGTPEPGRSGPAADTDGFLARVGR